MSGEQRWEMGIGNRRGYHGEASESGNQQDRREDGREYVRGDNGYVNKQKREIKSQT